MNKILVAICLVTVSLHGMELKTFKRNAKTQALTIITADTRLHYQTNVSLCVKNDTPQPPQQKKQRLDTKKQPKKSVQFEEPSNMATAGEVCQAIQDGEFEIADQLLKDGYKMCDHKDHINPLYRFIYFPEQFKKYDKKMLKALKINN